jgi:aquaporin Z
MASLSRRLMVEMVGTSWVVFVGCGCIVMQAASAPSAHATADAAFAFGLSAAIASYVSGRFSTGHFNPAVTVGFAVAQRFRVRDLLPCTAAQVLGATLGAWLVDYIASGRPGFDAALSDLSANGYGEHSPTDFQLHSALVIELAMSFVFVFVNLQMARRSVPRGIASLVTGGCLTAIYLVTIPVTNGSVNPARASGPALIAGGWALDQLWLFWAAPMAGGMLAGLLYSQVTGERRSADAAPRRAGIS